MKTEQERLQLHDDLVRGLWDEHLTDIQNALIERRKIINHKTLMSIKEGDRVRIVSGRPQYIVGSKATVKKVNYSKVVIDLDQPCGKYHRNITCPISMLRLLEGDEIIP